MADNPHLMFLVGEYFEEGKALRGASLVTDRRTRPIEFRCTTPVRPTVYQRTLYGRILEEYLFVDLIGLPLITTTREHVDLVLVDDARFLDARPSSDVPIVHLMHATQAPGRPTLTLRAHRKFTADEQIARNHLSALIEEGRDLFEPFERVRQALAQTHAQKVGDQAN